MQCENDKHKRNWQNLLIVIGASAGGVEPICEIIEILPEDFQAVIVVATHRDPNAEGNSLRDVLAHHTQVRVEEPHQGEEMECTTIYVSHGGDSVEFNGKEFNLKYSDQHRERISRIDHLFASAAEIAGAKSVGVILSGAMWDGVEGLRAIHDAGGRCLVQKPTDADFSTMPMNAIQKVKIDFVGSSREIAEMLIEFGRGEVCES